MNGATWLVFRNKSEADRARRQSNPRNTDLRFMYPAINVIAGSAPPQRIIVCEGVDLYQDVGGEGSFGALLERRQLTWGHKAEFIRL